MSLKVVVPLATVFLLPACLLTVPELENAKAEGRWTLTLKNEEDKCGFEGWMPGGGAFEIVIRQGGSNEREIEATLEGVVGLVLWFGLGTNALVGSIEGDQLSLAMFNTKPETAANGCLFKRELQVTAQVDGDRLKHGRVLHIPTAGPEPQCQQYRACQALQTFDGRRLLE